MFMRALVIGSNSFTGSHFINYILENAECSVVGVSRSPEYDPVFLPFLYRKTRPANYRFFQADINSEFEKFRSICDDFRPNVVVNYAAQGEVRNSWKWPEQWYLTNCIGVVRVAEHLRQRDYVEKYVAISTPEVYGAIEKNLKESHNYHPSTPYGASKLAGDLHLFALHKRYDFPVVFTRSANVYGIHQQLYRIIPRAIIYLKLGKPIELHGGGETRRSFIHVRDTADFTYRAILRGKNGEIYHSAPDGEPLRVADVVRLICELTGHDFERCVTMAQENFGQDSVLSLDASKAKRDLGWNPGITLMQGIEETIAWIEDNWDFIRAQPLEYVHKR